MEHTVCGAAAGTSQEREPYTESQMRNEGLCSDEPYCGYEQRRVPAQRIRLSETECDYNYCEDVFQFAEEDVIEELRSNPVGIALFNVIAMPKCSSTRAELAGLIQALANDRPVHVALDNQSVVDRARAILSKDFKPCRPWELTKDGDLWAIYQMLLSQRTVDNTTISKVKGHATTNDVDVG